MRKERKSIINTVPKYRYLLGEEERGGIGCSIQVIRWLDPWGGGGSSAGAMWGGGSAAGPMSNRLEQRGALIVHIPPFTSVASLIPAFI